MARFVVLILLLIGVIMIYQHQDEIGQKIQDILKNEKTISKVNGVSQKNEKMLMDAQRQVLEY